MKNWKQFEKGVAQALGGRRIVNARKDSRGDRIWFRSAPDVQVPSHPELKIDCKLYKHFTHHRMLERIQAKYCRLQDDEPVLVTGENGTPGVLVSIRLEFFAALLESRKRLEHFLRPFPRLSHRSPKYGKFRTTFFPLNLRNRIPPKRARDVSLSRTTKPRPRRTSPGHLGPLEVGEPLVLRLHDFIPNKVAAGSLGSRGRPGQTK